MIRALDGVRVIALATNIPGPIAAARLAAYGAHVRKIEPLAGDPLESSAPQWYAELTADVTVERRDLRNPEAREAFVRSLHECDLLLTTLRAPALQRLGLAWDALHAAVPRLCHVALFGEAPPNDGRAGHDLTYQARSGYLTPPAMPRTLIADMAAAERAVSTALEALAYLSRAGEGCRRDVAIVDAADAFGAPFRYGLTTPDGPLGGAFPGYGIYQAADGWLAVALLEAHFATIFEAQTGANAADRASIASVVKTRTRAEWERFAAEHDVPLASIDV